MDRFLVSGGARPAGEVPVSGAQHRGLKRTAARARGAPRAAAEPAARGRVRVSGGARLAGEVCVSGAKNSVLKLMAASLLAEGTTVLTNVPDILDVTVMCEVLRRLGCDVVRGPGQVEITVPERPGHEADYDLVRRIRASIAVLGPLVARCGEAKVALPGGDAIGSRGLDMHVAGLVKLGATVESEHGYLIARAPPPAGARGGGGRGG